DHLGFPSLCFSVKPCKLQFKQLVLCYSSQVKPSLGNLVKSVGVGKVHLCYLLVTLSKCEGKEILHRLGMNAFDIGKIGLFCSCIPERLCFFLPFERVIPEQRLRKS